MIGLTSCSSESAEIFKGLSSAIHNPIYWTWLQGHVWNNSNQVEVQKNISSLGDGNTVGMAVYPNGELHIYFNRKYIGAPFKNLPVSLPLYGVIGTSAGMYQIGKEKNVCVFALPFQQLTNYLLIMCTKFFYVS